MNSREWNKRVNDYQSFLAYKSNNTILKKIIHKSILKYDEKSR